MQEAQIIKLFRHFEAARQEISQVECWSARDLQSLLGYKSWRNFRNVIKKAVAACQNSGETPENHFVGVQKKVTVGSGAQREINDFALTRYACYLVAQNGDASKTEVAFAQTYFAVQTRRQELIVKRLQEQERLRARQKLKQSEKKLARLVYERGSGRSFAYIRAKGDQALFGGKATREMKEKLGVPQRRALADFLPTLLIKAKDFANELTSHNVVEKDLYGDQNLAQEHVENNEEVRKMLLKRGVKPEELPPAEDMKKVERRLRGSVKQNEKLPPKKKK